MIERPVIETGRLLLRVPEVRDFDAWAELDADEEAMRFIGGVETRAGSWMGFAAAVGMWQLRGAGLFSVIEKSSGQWVGRIGAWLPEDALGTEIGWAMAPAFWGTGFATEGARAAMAWAFETLGWQEVIHCIHAENTRSIAVARRLGSVWMRTDREGKEAVEVHGQSRAFWSTRAGTNPMAEKPGK